MNFKDSSRRVERMRKFKMGSMSYIITVSVVAIIILLNVVASMILAAFPVKLDMTGTGFYALSEETVEFLKTVDSKIKITLLADKNDFSAAGPYYNQVVECMELYARENNNITVEYVDLIDSPGFAANYPDRELKDGMIIVESEKTGRNITLNEKDYFNLELNSSTYSYIITSAKTEEALTSSIINTSDEDPKIIGVVAGHGETDISGLTELLKKNGYTIEQNVTLYAGKFETDYDGLIIAAPTNDFTGEELDLLDSYMENGGMKGKNIFYFASAKVSTPPNIAAYLAKWGVAFHDGTVYETDSSKIIGTDPFVSILSYSDNTFTEGLEASSVALTSPSCRPITLLFETSGDMMTETYVGFTSSAVLLPSSANTNIWKPEDAEVKGPFGALTVSKDQYHDFTDESQIKTYTSNLYAFGSIDFVAQGIVETTIFANGEYIIHMFDERFNRQTSISIVPKYVSSRSMTITNAAATTICVIFAGVIPLCVIAAGVYVWLRRRHA